MEHGEPEHGSPRTRARFSENQRTVLREPEHSSPRTRARFSENQSTVSENQITVLREPEHGSLRTRARFSENQSTVLQEPEHGSLRIRAHLSWRTGKHLHVLHVLRTYPTCSYPGYQDTTTYAALIGDYDDADQGCIIRSILPSGMGARGVSSEHVENMEMFSCSPT